MEPELHAPSPPTVAHKLLIYRIVGKFGGELNLVVWQIDQPTAKLKSANIKSLILDCTRAIRLCFAKQIGVCGLYLASTVLALVQMVDDMLLYRFDILEQQISSRVLVQLWYCFELPLSCAGIYHCQFLSCRITVRCLLEFKYY